MPATADRQSPTVAFILSANRSGSTWLNFVLGAHRWASGLGEIRRVFAKAPSVICRRCEADGLEACTKLDGIRTGGADACHVFAARRLGTPVIVDASKTLDWCARFVDRPDLDVRLIHLVRHPCGFVESERRRSPDAGAATLLDRWALENETIARFVASSGRASILSSYDALAMQPATAFPVLCDFLDHDHDAAALAYWRFDHHGLGANGAASLHLRGRRTVNFKTGDDDFYDRLAAGETGIDQRWMERLPDDQIAMIVHAPAAVAMAQRLGLGQWPGR